MYPNQGEFGCTLKLNSDAFNLFMARFNSISLSTLNKEPKNSCGCWLWYPRLSFTFVDNYVLGKKLQ